MLKTYLIPMCVGIIPDSQMRILDLLRTGVLLLERTPMLENNLKKANSMFEKLIPAVEQGIIIKTIINIIINTRIFIRIWSYSNYYEDASHPPFS